MAIHMNMLLKTYSCLLIDISRLTGIHLDLPDDLTMSWVLIEAPALDKQVLQYIEGNRDQIPTFPEWLKPLWDAFIANNSDPGILKYIRTCLVFGYKAEYEPTNEQLQEAQKAFEEANATVGLWNRSFIASTPRPMFREARRLVGLVLQRSDFKEVIPCHGPGAVFPRHSPSQKGNFSICSQINDYYPYDQFFNGVHNVGYEDLTSRDYSTYDQIMCRMVAVPKDSRGPRLICVHPKEAVWIQQGQRHILERAIESCPLTSGRINFRDQKVNGSLALTSSLSQEYTTLDMKEASDRVGTELVHYLFGNLSKILSSTRANYVTLIDGRQLKLEMFAPMGNALTFPVESLVFWSLVRAGILSRHGHHCDNVYVFGDDIVVPTKYYEGAVEGLVSAGLIPNMAKTFRKGFFRESCGVDAYRGKDVTPLRCKIRHIVTYSDGESACDLAKRSRMQGFTDTSSCLYSMVSKRFGRLSLTNNPDCQGLIEYCRYDLGDLIRYEPRVKFDTSTHNWVVPYRKRVRTLEVLTNHAWWHVQDSLLSLIRKDHDYNSPVYGSLLISERGLEYPSPRGERLTRGFCVLMQN